MNESRLKDRSKKVNTKGKYLNEIMQIKLQESIKQHRGLLIIIALEQARRHGIPIQVEGGVAIGWLADLISAGIYGMCRGALAWQQKKIEGLKTTDYDGELKQAARVRIRQLAIKISRHIIIS